MTTEHDTILRVAISRLRDYVRSVDLLHNRIDVRRRINSLALYEGLQNRRRIGIRDTERSHVIRVRSTKSAAQIALLIVEDDSCESACSSCVLGFGVEWAGPAAYERDGARGVTGEVGWFAAVFCHEDKRAKNWLFVTV